MGLGEEYGKSAHVRRGISTVGFRVQLLCSRCWTVSLLITHRLLSLCCQLRSGWGLGKRGPLQGPAGAGEAWPPASGCQ